MSAKADQPSSSSDEIDLLELMLILWKRRIILGLSALAFFSLGVLLALAHTPTYKGQVQVHQLNEIEMAGFDAWNQGVRIATQSALPVTTQSALPVTTQSALPVTMETLLQNDTNSDLSSITSKSLADNFYASYQRGDALVAALRKHSTAVQNFNGDEEELDLMLSEMANDFALNEDSKSRKVSIVFTTSDKAESSKILSSTLDMISSNSKADLLRSIQSKLEAARLSRELELGRIATEFEGYSQIYEARKKRSLTLLREQANIARELGIENPTYSMQNSSRQAQIYDIPEVGLDTFESHYFLQGYRAIEKQIANIEQRNDNQNSTLVAEIDQLVLNRTLVEKSNILGTITTLIATLPLNDQNFNLVRVDLAKTRFESDGSRRLIAIFVTLVGLLITVVLILANAAIKRRSAD